MLRDTIILTLKMIHIFLFLFQNGAEVIFLLRKAQRVILKFSRYPFRVPCQELLLLSLNRVVDQMKVIQLVVASG